MKVATIETPAGPGRLLVSSPASPGAVLLLGHGAGGGVDVFDLTALAELLPSRGIAVARFEQPWRTAGKRIASPPATLDVAWRPAVAATGGRFPGVPLLVGGRSAGARVACRGFGSSALGVVCLSFPLHPPGRPRASRIAELADVAGPVLVVQGDRDPFGSPEEVRAAVAAHPNPHARVSVVAVPGTHSFVPLKREGPSAADERRAAIAAVVGRFVASVAGLPDF